MIYDLCVIGGGASGMMCAHAAQSAYKEIVRGRTGPELLKICVIEKLDRPGRKILATGNGRCNISNSGFEGHQTVRKVFSDIGLEMKEEARGRMYPVSGRAADVVFLLENALLADGVEIITGTRVTGAEKTEDGYFRVRTKREESGNAGTGAGDGSAGSAGRGAPGVISGGSAGGTGELTARRIVIATGGKAGPAYGCTGDGYPIARSFGHTVTKLAPALSAVEVSDDISCLSGVRTGAKVTLLRRSGGGSGREFDEEDTETAAVSGGEVQFTDSCLSGICVFDISGDIVLDEDTGFSDHLISLDVLDGKTAGYRGGEDTNVTRRQAALEMLGERRRIPGLKASDIFASILPGALGRYIAGRALEGSGFKACGKSAGELTDDEILAIVREASDLRFRVSGVKGWRYAQVTRGGVPVGETDPRTGESLRTEGLYITGEMLDTDGPCGGYNLGAAWLSGIKAGRDIAAKAAGERT